MVKLNILIFSDLHNHIDKEIDKIKNIPYDYCFILGDISVYNLKMILKYIDKQKIYAVLGNHDDLELLDKFGIKNIHGTMINLNDIKIVGFSGSFKYKNSNTAMFNQKESIEIFKLLPAADILISHDTGYRLMNFKDSAHQGFKGITKYIEKHKPKLNLFGHYHRNTDFKYKNTKCICIYQCAILDTTDFSISHIF